MLGTFKKGISEVRKVQRGVQRNMQIWTDKYGRAFQGDRSKLTDLQFKPADRSKLSGLRWLNLTDLCRPLVDQIPWFENIGSRDLWGSDCSSKIRGPELENPPILELITCRARFSLPFPRQYSCSNTTRHSESSESAVSRYFCISARSRGT